MKNEKIIKVFYIFTLGMLCAFPPMCSDMYLPSLPDIMEFFSTNTASVQASLTASFIGLAIGQILIGPVSDAYGRFYPLMISLVIFALSSLLCAISSSITMFILCRFVQGLAASGGVVLTRSIACDRFKGNELTSFMAFLMAINSLAPILGPIAGSLIVTFFSWKAVFYVLLVWGLFLIALVKFFVPESLAKDHREVSALVSIKRMRIDLSNLKFMLIVFSLSFIMGGFFSYLTASPFVFQVIYSFTPFEYSLSFAAIAFSISAVAPLAGRLCIAFGSIRVIFTSYAIMSLAAVLIFVIALIKPDSFVPIFLALALFCSMLGLSQSVGFGLVMGCKKGGAGTASGILGVMHFMLGSVATPFVGVLGEKSMLPLGIIMILCCTMAVLTLIIAQKIEAK
ncbi:MAG: multidrug effflux MFS transporter [Succinivibrio sp.]